MTVDHNFVPSTQSNFTILVSVTDATLRIISNGGHVANSNGYDIGFYTDSSGSTKLKWEIESYNPVTGQLIAWVKIPTLSSTSDTSFYLFYGDPSITSDQSDPVNTWDSNFKAVYHLGNGITLTASDSTGGNNGTLFHSPTAVGGEIDGAAHFVSASTQTINLGTPSDFPITTAWSAEAWVNPVAAGAMTVVGWGQNVNNGVRIGANGTGGTWVLNFWGGASTNGGTVSAGSWQHVVGTFDGSSLRLYKNGSLVAGPKSASPATSANPGGWIGSFSGIQSFNGDIDEVRISNTNRSADWIQTEYNNQNSPGTFITMGSESCPSATPTPTPTATPSATPTATPTATPPSAADNFNRADGGLGANWAKPVPASQQTLVIVNNQVTPNIENAHCYAYWIGNTFSQDQYSQVQISNVGPWNGVIARAQPGIDRFYMAFVFGPNDYRLYLRKDGLYYSLATNSTETWVAGDIIRLEASGLNPVQLTLLRNGNPVLTYTDTTENLVGGSSGIGIYSPAGDHLTIDNWQGGSLGPLGPLMVATQAPTVAGNLVATALGMSQVKLTWAEPIDKRRVRRYEVQRRDPGSTSFVQVGTTTTTSYIDTALAAGSKYSYRVLVRDARGSLKKYSGVASVTTGSPTIVPLRSP